MDRSSKISPMAAAATAPSRKTETYTDTKRRDDMHSIADAVCASLGPRGMDKMISSGDQSQEVINTNDGAKILSRMALLQPAGRMLTELSRSQDAAATATAPSRKTETYTDTKRRDDVLRANFAAARSVANAVRTSLGPRGMDKRIYSGDQWQEVIITNDGGNILSRTALLQQPAVRMLAELSHSQDAASGDGTTAPSMPENVSGK